MCAAYRSCQKGLISGSFPCFAPELKSGLCQYARMQAAGQTGHFYWRNHFSSTEPGGSRRLLRTRRSARRCAIRQGRSCNSRALGHLRQRQNNQNRASLSLTKFVVADRRPRARFLTPPGRTVTFRELFCGAFLVSVVASGENRAGNLVEQFSLSGPAPERSLRNQRCRQRRPSTGSLPVRCAPDCICMPVTPRRRPRFSDCPV